MIVDNQMMEGIRKLCHYYIALTRPNGIRLEVMVYTDEGAPWEYNPLSDEFQRFVCGMWHTDTPKTIRSVEFIIKANHPVDHKLCGYCQSLDVQVIKYRDRDDYFDYIATNDVRRLVLSMYGI